MKLVIILIIFLSLFTNQLIAEPVDIKLNSIYYGAFSWHNECGPGCNQNNNWALGAEFSYKQNDYIIVTLLNSNSKRSVLAAQRNNIIGNGDIKLDYIYGGVPGYCDYPVPFIAPLIQLWFIDLSCLSDFNRTVCAGLIKYGF